MIRALIFDFDGLILDTETPDVIAWQKIYAEHGLTFPVALWGSIIGGMGRSHFDAAEHLEQSLGTPLDRSAVKERQNVLSHSLLEAQPVLPGVRDYLRAGRELKLKLAIASSSEHAWVDAHLARLGLAGAFDTVICRDDVPPGRVKPYPDLYLLALASLQVAPGEAVVFEDSPNGVEAARAAGIPAVAVPNPATSGLTFRGESLRLGAMSEMPLADLLLRLDPKS